MNEGYAESYEVVIAAEVFVKPVPLGCGAVSGEGQIGYGVTANAIAGSSRDG